MPACPRCEKEFKTPATLARHTNAKKQCVAVAAAPAAAGAADPFTRSVWEARNIVRRAGVTGLESLDCIVSLFALREVERLYPRLADPATWKLPMYVDAHIDYAVNEGFVLFSRIADTPCGAENHRNVWHERVRGALEALQYHPDTAKACAPLYDDPAKMFPLTDSAAAHALVRLVRDKLAFDVGGDSVGRAFMSIVRDFLDGKELGQFFTPPPVVDYLAARAAEGRALGRVFDPTCGSGGFLAAAARGGAAEVHGIEIDARVRLLGYFNALVSGATAPRVARADFTRGPVADGPFGTVLANPPFGVKGVDYAELTEATGPNGAEGFEAFPLKSTATGLFLQRIIRCLAVGGRGCVVLPLGKELAGRAPAEVVLRRALLSAVAVREIVAIPSGVFENTGIRTVALIFDKVHELGDCIERARRGKGVVATLRADIEPATRDIRLVQLRADGKTVIAEAEPIPGTQASISIEQIEETGWSLSPDDYKANGLAGAPGAAPLSEYPMVRLGDIFTLKKGRIQSTKTVPGAFPVISIGLGKTHNEATDDDEVLVITIVSAGNSCGPLVVRIHYHNGPCAITNIVGRLIPINGAQIDLRYAKYVLDSMVPVINTSCEKGLANKTLDQSKFFNVEIPLPPLEVQRAIAAELDAQAADIAALETAAAAAERAKRIALDNALYRRGFLRAHSEGDRLADGIELVRLGDLCEMIKGKTYTTKASPGPIPLYTSAAEQLSSTSFDEETPALLIACEGTVGYAHAPPEEKYAVGHRCYVLRSDRLHYPYAARWLNYNRVDNNTKHARGAVTQTLNKERLSAIEIPLPPLEVQRAIAAELDTLHTTAVDLRKAVDRARAAMKTTLGCALVGCVAVSDGQDSAAACDDQDGAAVCDGQDSAAVCDSQDSAATCEGQDTAAACEVAESVADDFDELLGW